MEELPQDGEETQEEAPSPDMVEAHAAQDMLPEEELEELEAPLEHLRIEDIRKVKLPITADLGHCDLNVREVLELKPGSVLAMDKLAGEMADLYVGAQPLARGEVVVLGDTLHVRIAEIFGLSEGEGGGGYEES